MIRKLTPEPSSAIDQLITKLNNAKILDVSALKAFVLDLAVIVKDLPGGTSGQCNLQVTRPDGQTRRCKEVGQHDRHTYDPWTEVSAVSDWAEIRAECGTAPTAWARALDDVIIRQTGQTMVDMLTGWFGQAMLAVASEQGEALTAQVMRNTQIANELSGLRDSYRAIHGLQDEHERNLAKELGLEPGKQTMAWMIKHAGALYRLDKTESLVKANDALLKQTSDLEASNGKLKAELEFERKAKALLVRDVAQALGVHVDTPWWNMISLMTGDQALSKRANELDVQVKQLTKDCEDLRDESRQLTQQLDNTKGRLGMAQANILDAGRSLEKAGIPEGEPLSIRIDELARQLKRALEDVESALNSKKVTQEQLDKFQGVCGGQAIQIMELRSKKAVVIGLARDVVKNIDATIRQLDNLHPVIVDTDFSWLKARQFSSEARDWLAEAITKADK